MSSPSRQSAPPFTRGGLEAQSSRDLAEPPPVTTCACPRGIKRLIQIACSSRKPAAAQQSNQWPLYRTRFHEAMLRHSPCGIVAAKTALREAIVQYSPAAELPATFPLTNKPFCSAAPRHNIQENCLSQILAEAWPRSTVPNKTASSHSPAPHCGMAPKKIASLAKQPCRTAPC